MLALRDTDPPHPGDLLHHPRVGFLVVDRVDDAVVTGELIGERGRRAHRVPRADLSLGWSLCPPGGFAERAVTDPGALAGLLERDAPAGIRLLLDEVGGRVSEEDLREWIVGRRVLSERAFAAWWAHTRQALRDADGLKVDGDAVVARGDANDTELPTARLAAVRDAPATARVEMVRAAVAAGDGDRARLLIRDLGVLQDDLVHDLADLGLRRSPALLAALLTRREAVAIAVAAESAASRGARPAIERATALLPRSRRPVVVLAILEASLGGAGGEASALWIGDALADSRTAGATEAGFPRARRFLVERTAEATLKHAVRPTARPLVHLRPLGPSRVWPISIGLARALAARHAEGLAGGVGSARITPEGALELGAPEGGRPEQDVASAMRTLATLAIGRTPGEDLLDDESLLAHIGGLAPHLPPAWLAVLTRALAPDPGRRPRSGLELWEQLAQAEALERVRAEAPPRPAAAVRVGSDTHIGRLKARLSQANQDACWFATRDDLTIAIVADGISVSTAGRGDMASALLVRTLSQRWDESTVELAGASFDAIEAFLADALDAANVAICQTSLRLAGGQLGRHIPMGTTAVAAVLRGDHGVLASLGDSRAYLVGACGAASLLGDQNLRGAWLRSWQQGAPIELDGDGYALVGYVGRFGPDDRPESHPVQLRRVRLLPGESVVLCSDGLPDYARPSAAELAADLEAACAADDPEAAARQLVTVANEGGGGDNVTVLVLQQHSG